MADYQRIKQTKYILGRTVYNKTIWRIRDYNRLKDVANSMIDQSPAPRQPKTSQTYKISDPVLDAVAKREKYLKEINVIDKCLELIPEEYRKGVWNNIMYKEPYPQYADRNTYGRYKSKFIFDVAHNLELL